MVAACALVSPALLAFVVSPYRQNIMYLLYVPRSCLGQQLSSLSRQGNVGREIRVNPASLPVFPLKSPVNWLSCSHRPPPTSAIGLCCVLQGSHVQFLETQPLARDGDAQDTRISVVQASRSQGPAPFVSSSRLAVSLSSESSHRTWPTGDALRHTIRPKPLQLSSVSLPDASRRLPLLELPEPAPAATDTDTCS